MNDQHKSKKQLIEELSELRQRLQRLEDPKETLCHKLNNNIEGLESPALNSHENYQISNGFKTLMENAPDAIIRFDSMMRFLYANPLAINITGIPPLHCLGKTVTELQLKGKCYDLWKSHVKKVSLTKQSSMFEAEFTGCNGQSFYYHISLAPEFTQDNIVESVLCTIRNISALKESELALQASERRNQKLLSSLPDLLFLMSKEGNFLDYHITNTSLLYASLAAHEGKHISETLPDAPSKRIMTAIKKAINTGKAQFLEYYLSINNTIYFFEGRIIKYDTDNVLFIVRDITELKHLRQEIIRLDQLNIVGELAASIGHEVRNPLTTVRGFLQLLSKKKECTSLKEYFDLMIEELDRANSIISEFLSLAKNKKAKFEPQNLNTIIKTISPLIESNATINNKNIVLDLNPIPELLLNSQEIRQLILNLVHNGLDAMPPHTNLLIKTAVENNHVVLSIKDEGMGISPETLEKLGTPFFTTKETGTGLGLPICYSIAARHKAAIKVSTTSKGTTFFITFGERVPIKLNVKTTVGDSTSRPQRSATPLYRNRSINIQ
jgi:two-component system, sporulation sensor kinase E